MIDTRVMGYEARGASATLFDLRETREVLLEGPAGTGKTRTVLELIDVLCCAWPYLRVLLCRDTRKSMTISVLPILEDEVLWPGNATLGSSKANRDKRTSYVYPNGAVIDVLGVQDVRAVMSAQYDVIVFVEATDGEESDWEYLMSRGLGRPRDTSAEHVSKIPYKLAIAECNPDREDHWLNRRADDGKMLRLVTKHADNPTLDGEAGVAYLKTLSELTGVRRDRLFLGRWISAEGLIYPNWKRSKHCVQAAGNADPRLDIPAQVDAYVGSCDWGTRDAGVLQVWACVEDARPMSERGKGKPIRRAWRVEHVYHTQKLLSWWADHFERTWKTYQPDWIVADPARKDLIEHMNERLGPIANRTGDAAVVVKGRNAHASRSGEKGDMVGFDLCRWTLEEAEDGLPRCLFVQDALVGGADPLLTQARQPWCLEEEIRGYQFIKQADGARVREVPDPSCKDHELDAWRYFCAYWWGNDVRKPAARTPVDMTRVRPGNRGFAKALAAYGPEAFAGDPRFKGFDPYSELVSVGEDVEDV